ncbi:LacI family DNA-binding transcriptional regulator [Clostridium weizhouense]|uniref:Substrate-binding domain-containing protein n=1 Tax=Clostridium weizhouense TaxID=2859781 RepID=A0ABS7AR24_9CLOT|nr:substrate-binding domain-containing protein [Clostridium weizhouense]MBW6411127.1 substrate-binding domain-containing protein [Clostridium weizhouense]
MTPTIKDVAKLSNVSVATVSRILNNLGGYSEETRIQVLKVVNEIGYKRNAIARSLSTNTTRTIGVIIPDVSTNFDGEIIRGIEDSARNNNYSVILCNTGSEGIRTLEYLRIVEERKLDAVIIVSIQILDEYYKVLNKMNIPYILISTKSFNYDMPYIKVDDISASYAATKYLLDRGHKNIAMISGTKKDPIAGWPRVQGYINALLDYGIKLDDELIVYGDFSYKSGIECMNILLNKKKKFTAIFVASDDMAVGVLNVAYRESIRIPEDLSVIGYDNTKIAIMSIPPLTTLSQPLYEMGCKAFNEILNMLNGKESKREIIMQHNIVERETVKWLK